MSQTEEEGAVDKHRTSSCTRIQGKLALGGILSPSLCSDSFFFLTDFREKEGEREGERDRQRQRQRLREKHRFVVTLIRASLVDSCICPDRISNPHPWHMGSTL